MQGDRVVKQLIEDIAKALVDIPEEVAVRVVEGEQVTVLELRVAPSDLGKVIGKQGRTARSIRTILDHEPNIIAPGHGKPYIANRADLEDSKRRPEGQQRYFSDVIADRDSNFGLNPSWLRLYPYQLSTKPGSVSALERRLRNYRSAPMRLEAALVLPEGWTAGPEVDRFEVPPMSDGHTVFTVEILVD